jgi:hypothetical protein
MDLGSLDFGFCRKSSNLRENRGETKANTRKKETRAKSEPSITVAEVNS